MKISIKHTTKFLAPVALVSAFALTSCTEDFLDREPDGYYITDDQVRESAEWNANVMLGNVNGISTNLVKWGAGGTSNHSDFGQKSVDIATDLLAGDMVFPNGCSYGWFRADATMSNTLKSNAGPSTDWTYYYNIISSANYVFKTLGSDTEEPENATSRVYFATAKTVRAFAYFKLATLFSKSYELSKDKQTLPLYTDYDTQANKYGSPVTIGKVYEQIHTDLDGAISAFTSAAEEEATPSDISTPGIDVAYTLNAYAYLEQGNYEAAYENAALAIRNSGKQILSASELTYGFNTINNDNWMWGFDITAESTGGLCTFWGMIDPFTYSYAYAGDEKVVNSELYAQLPATDARRNWFFNLTLPETSPYYKYLKYCPTTGAPTGKFHTADIPNSYVNSIFCINYLGADRSWESDIHFMRIEEPYMIAAEAACRLGNTAVAAAYLKAILDERDTEKAESLASMTADELLDEIYFEWRMEFWGEGKALETIKRFKKTITRPGNDAYNYLTTDNYYGPVSYDSYLFMYAIPQQELQYNPNMKDAQQ